MADKCECEIGFECVAGSCHCKDLRSRAEARNRVLAAYDVATSELKVAARQAVNDGMKKIEVARQADVTRRTLDAWLTESVCATAEQISLAVGSPNHRKSIGN